MGQRWDVLKDVGGQKASGEQRLRKRDQLELKDGVGCSQTGDFGNMSALSAYN